MSDSPTVQRGQFVHDVRHRYSVELRPTAAFDAALRALALQLENTGLVPAGQSALPRFHPHLTVGRAASTAPELIDHVASVVRAAGADFTFTSAATFGYGRIIYLELGDAAIAHAARTAMVAQLDPAELDPLMVEREWIPHVTIAYAVPEEHRAAALEHVRASLPLQGACATVEAWDLDVRPTRLVHRTPIVS